jgi:hypothetical protein
MLLKDFNDADNSLANTKQLFSYLGDLKDLEQRFDLSEEDKKRVETFWKNFFGTEPGKIRKSFLDNWKHLGNIYSEFREILLKENIAYQGLLSRSVTESLSSLSQREGQIVFAGFNALTKAEQKIVRHFMNNEGAVVYYDTDEYYLDDPRQEAGTFLRGKETGHLNGGEDHQSMLLSGVKKIEAIGVPLQSLQAKVAGQIINDHPDIFNSNNTAIVLPDEQLLLPVLHSIPAAVTDINVTMGFPLHASPLFTLVDSLFELQNSFREKSETFYFKNVHSVLSHPYLEILFSEKIEVWL